MENNSRPESDTLFNVLVGIFTLVGGGVLMALSRLPVWRERYPLTTLDYVLLICAFPVGLLLGVRGAVEITAPMWNLPMWNLLVGLLEWKRGRVNRE